MSKVFMIVLAVVLSLGVASLGFAQAPAATDKKMDEKKADKAEKKADKAEKKADEKKAEAKEKKAEAKDAKKAANPCAAKK